MTNSILEVVVFVEESVNSLLRMSANRAEEHKSRGVFPSLFLTSMGDPFSTRSRAIRS